MKKFALWSVILIVAVVGCGPTAEPPTDQPQGPAPTAGTWTGTITYTVIADSTKIDEGSDPLPYRDYDHRDESWEGEVQVGSSELFEEYEEEETGYSAFYTLRGVATMDYHEFVDYQSTFSVEGLTCSKHYTDTWTAQGAGEVEIGLQIGANFQDSSGDFHGILFDFPSVSGTHEWLRDETGCNGTSTSGTNPYESAPISISESADYDPNSPNRLQGSSTGPITDEDTGEQIGTITITWDLTRQQ